MRLNKVIKMFENGNVMVFGLRGTGKDLLFCNVIARRKTPYVSYVDYGCQALRIPWNYDDIDIKNTYRDFAKGDVKYYSCPYPDGTDVYLPDVGVMFPAQYCNELNRDYKSLASYMALCRHLHNGSVHTNSQALRRPYDKIREQSEQYIMCMKCYVWHGWVLQKVRIYELYDAADRRAPPFRLTRPWFSAERRQKWNIEKEHYEQTFGKVEEGWLLYRHKGSYDSRIFKTMMENGIKDEKKNV